MKLKSLKLLTAYRLSAIFLGGALILSLGNTVAKAQFEGSFKVQQFLYSKNGHAQNEGTANVYMTPTRIRITGLNGSKMPAQLGGIKTNSILIRLDLKDFIIFGQNSEAVQIKKSEIVNMMDMVNNMSSQLGTTKNDDLKSDRKVIKTKETKHIDGFPCHKIIVIDKDGNQVSKSIVWVTKKYAVNWGMLTEPWGNENSEIAPFLSPTWLQNGTMPIYAEMYENGVKKTVLKVVDVKKQKIPKSYLKIPAGYQLMSWRQLLLHNMFGR
ncbi:MAG TPA: DUF4412 domain-containing protein [Balneolales bacterium]|nr:DUF4412 domain-containing protein [Balneolales bacterium]